jgi:predicted transcriptional regulator
MGTEGRMAITLHLTPEQEAKLRSVATPLKVSPEALAEAAVRDLLALPDDAVLKVAQAIVAENRELYRRLSAGPERGAS